MRRRVSPAQENKTIPEATLVLCDAQGPSDSEGAVIKTGLRSAEDKSAYFGDTVAAHKWAVENDE